MESMEIDKGSKGSKRSRKKDKHLKGVSMDESGKGFPYAPENWPNPGDTWSWKVGKRVASDGYFADRYLYAPKHLRRKDPDGKLKKYRFQSKLSVEKYIRKAFPGADMDSFFSSFTLKIQAKRSLINGQDQNLLPPPSEENAETQSQSAAMPFDGVACKAGNKMCESLLSNNSCEECYGYIKCEALFGGSTGLDAEYYCRRCDARTDLIPYCVGLLETCKSVDSQDELEKILSVGLHILKGCVKTDASLNVELLSKIFGNQRRMPYLLPLFPLLVGNATLSAGGDVAQEVADGQDVSNNRARRLQGVVSPSLDCEAETLKLECEIDQVLQELQKSQEYEYRIAQERSDYLHRKPDSNADDLWTAVLHRVDQINKEVAKLKDMGRVGIGFARLPKSIRRKHFGLRVQK